MLVTPYLEGSDVKEFQRTLTRRLDAWDLDKRVDRRRVEIVEQRISPTTYVRIGGNTSSGAGGSASNGGGVFRNTRTTEAAGGRITTFVRPPYNR